MHGPTLAHVAHNECAADDGSKHRTSNHSKSVANNRSVPLIWSPNVTEYATSIGDGSRAEKTGEKSRYDDCLNIFSCGGSKGEDATDEGWNQNDPLSRIMLVETHT